MADLKDIDISHVKIGSSAFPSADDLKVWHRLSPKEQAAVIMRDIREGLDGPKAKRQTKDDIISAALSRYAAPV